MKMYMVWFQRTISSAPIIVGFTTNFKQFMTDYLNERSVISTLSDKQCITEQKQFYSAILIEEGKCKFHWMRGIELVKIVHNVIESFHKKYRFIDWIFKLKL